MSSTDWSTFNGKQAAGNYITALTGDVTASGPGSAVTTIANDAVSFSKMQNINSQIILGRNTASSGDIEALSAGTVKTILSLNNVENTALSTWAGTTNLVTLGAFTATGHVTIEGVTSTGATGTGKFVFDTSPTLTTPNIGTASGTKLSLSTGSTNGLAIGSATIAESSATGDLVLSSQSSHGGSIVLGDAAGSTKLYIKDSATASRFSVDSDGNMETYGTISFGTLGSTDTNLYRSAADTLKTDDALSVAGALSVSGHVTTEGVTSTGATGTGKFVFDTSPTLATPNIGAATASSLSSSGIIKNDYLRLSTNTFEEYLTDTDGAAINVNYRGYNGGTTRFRDFLVYNGKNTVILNIDGSTSGATFSGALAVNGHVTLEGVTSTGATGTGALVFSSSPTMVSPTLGAATATSITIGANTLNTTEWAYLDGQNQGVATTDAVSFNRVSISGAVSAGSWSTAGIGFKTSAATYTNTTTAAGGTVTHTAIHAFATPVLDSTNSITSTSASTLYIANAPTAGANTTIGNSYALYVAAGKNYMGDSLWIGGTSSTAAKLMLQGNVSTDAWTTNGVALKISAATYTDTSSTGTVAGAAISTLGTPNLAASDVGGVTYTDAATLRIGGAPVAYTNVTITNPWALWVDGGDVRFDSGLSIGASTSAVLGNPGGGQIQATSSSGSVLTLGRYDTAVGASDLIGGLQFYANDTSTTTNNYAAAIKVYATNTIATDINPGTMIFYTTPTDVGGALTESYRILNTQDLQLADGTDLVFNATTGTKIGTATTQKLGFFNATPIVQPSNTTDIKDAISGLGLIASGGATPLNLDGGSLQTTGHAALGGDGAISTTAVLNILETSSLRLGSSYGSQNIYTASPSGTLSGTLYHEAAVNTAVWDSAQNGAASDYGNIYGAVNGASTASTATGALYTATGAYDRFVHIGSGAVSSGIANYSYVATDNTNTGGSITSAYNYYAQAVHSKTVGVITNRYGLYVADATGAGTITNQYGIYLGSMSKGGTLNYAIYSVSGDNFFGGTVQAGGYKSADGTAGADVACAAGKGIKSVTFKNGLLTAATCTTNSLTDLAENYGTNDSSIEAGDVVAVSSSQDAQLVQTESGQASKAYIEKANSQNASMAIGIISKNPEMTLGEDIYSANENARAVALSGRVSVKVNNQNGPIKKGDLITVSDTSGYATKATDNSVITIGSALEDFNGTTGTIVVFVDISHKLGSSSVVQLASTGALKVDSLTVEGDAIFKGIIKGNDKFAGQVSIPAGQTEIRVSKSWTSVPASVVLTPSYNTHAWTTRIDETGFTVMVDSVPDNDQTVSWIAIF